MMSTMIDNISSRLPSGPAGLFVCTLLLYLVYTMTSNIMMGIIISTAVTAAYIAYLQTRKVTTKQFDVAQALSDATTPIIAKSSSVIDKLQGLLASLRNV